MVIDIEGYILEEGICLKRFYGYFEEGVIDFYGVLAKIFRRREYGRVCRILLNEGVVVWSSGYVSLRDEVCSIVGWVSGIV